MRLEGQVAIVTGAGQGIGRAIAKTLAGEGAAVVVNDIDLEKASKVAEEIKSQGGRALSIKADVSNKEEVNSLVEQTLDSFKRIDILVNNAGTAKLTPTVELTEAEWDSTVDVDLKGQFLCSQAVAKHMIKQKRGKIVNIASLAAHIGTPGLAAYSASKGGVVQLTKVLAVEWGKHNITVNAVSPGLTMTELVEAVFKERPDVFEGVERIPLKRLAMPEDIANAVLFLASPESDYISGQVIAVDGGALSVHPRMVRPTE
jgi:NAD(P)-dependent dehydrogenase (short-subunit alcohol dehydrogenase family)